MRTCPIWRVLALGLVVLLVTCGCQRAQQSGPSDSQAASLAAGDAALRQKLADHEAEFQALQRQYNEILRQRELELATCQAHSADLQSELEEIAAENAELRKKIRTVKTELARLQDVIGPPSEPTDER